MVKFEMPIVVSRLHNSRLEVTATTTKTIITTAETTIITLEKRYTILKYYQSCCVEIFIYITHVYEQHILHFVQFTWSIYGVNQLFLFYVLQLKIFTKFVTKFKYLESV